MASRKTTGTGVAGPSKKLQRVVRVRLPLKDARDLLLEGATVATWFGAERANIDPRTGGKYEVFWNSKDVVDSTKGCKINELTADSLVVDWIGPSAHALFKGMEKAGSTTVAFKLISDGDSTVITIEHRGIDAIADAKAALLYYTERWKIWADNLELIGGLSGKFRAVNDVVRGLQGTSAPTVKFADAPGKGVRPRFDFSKISLDTNALFGNSTVLRNLVDQA